MRHAALAAVSVVGHAGVVEDGAGALVDMVMACIQAWSARLRIVIRDLNSCAWHSLETQVPGCNSTRSTGNSSRGCLCAPCSVRSTL